MPASAAQREGSSSRASSLGRSLQAPHAEHSQILQCDMNDGKHNVLILSEDLPRLLPRSRMSWPGGNAVRGLAAGRGAGVATEVFVAGKRASHAKVVAFVVFLSTAAYV